MFREAVDVRSPEFLARVHGERKRDLSIRKAAMQLIARSEWFAEAVAAAPQIQAFRGTNPVVIVILTAPATAACPEIKALR